MAIPMLERLREAERTYRDLEASLSDPAVSTDPTRLARVMREYRSMTP